MVAGRPRKRSELSLRALLRHRVAAGQARAARQGAAADPGRTIRRRARARRAAARFPDDAFVVRYFERDAAGRSKAAATGAGRHPRQGGGRSRSLTRRRQRAKRTRRAAGEHAGSHGDHAEASMQRDDVRRTLRQRLAALLQQSGIARRSLHATLESFNGQAGDSEASIACTRCSTRNRIGWLSGARHSTRSTTGGSSTSTSWRDCAWKRPRCSRPRTRWSSTSVEARVVTGLRVDHPDGLYDPAGVLSRRCATPFGRGWAMTTCMWLPRRCWRATSGCERTGK